MNLTRCLILVKIVILSSCIGAPPKIDIETWAGSSATSSFRRKQENREIVCSDPKIDKMVAMTYVDLKEIFDTIQLCEKWPSGVGKMSAKEVAEVYRFYRIISKKAEEK